MHWQSGTAQLLPRLLGGRTRGPVFLTDRRAPARTPSRDVCPATGRARLSYRRAAELFEQHTRPLTWPSLIGEAELAVRGGWTLHQLRHAAVTHEAEDGTNTPTLLARSRHASVRSLERYARPVSTRSPTTSRPATPNDDASEPPMSSARRELISPAARIAARELASGVVLRDINNLWESEGFAPGDPKPWETGLGQRRDRFQCYLDAVDWADERHVARAVRVFASLLHDHYVAEPDLPDCRKLRRELESSGYRFNDDGRITKIGVGLRPGALTDLTDASAIHDGLERIRRAEQHEDPALVIGAAKELIESTAKLVLTELGEPVDPRADIQKLIRGAQKALGLLPRRDSGAGPDGTEAVKKILSSASAIAVGVAELRNRGYGTGHGPAGPRHGLAPRHAHLAANAAITWCELILETFADPRAPWHTATGTPATAPASPSETGSS